MLGKFRDESEWWTRSSFKLYSGDVGTLLPYRLLPLCQQQLPRDTPNRFHNFLLPEHYVLKPLLKKSHWNPQGSVMRNSSQDQSPLQLGFQGPGKARGVLAHWLSAYRAMLKSYHSGHLPDLPYFTTVETREGGVYLSGYNPYDVF